MNASSRRAIGWALAVYLAWVIATYLLEGLPGTLNRPEAAGLRLTYALGANLVLGVILPAWVIRRHLRAGFGHTRDYGFGAPRRTALAVVAALAAGGGLFLAGRAGATHPLVALNAFAQVWVVSVAEIVVCWALVGGTAYAALRSRGTAVAGLAAATASSLLFGVYHFAHSPPFNQPGMVAFLTGIGFVTSLFWFIARDVYGTAVFHNFFGVTGVLAALEAARLVPSHPTPAVGLLVTAAIVLAALVLADRAWIRPATPLDRD